MLWIIQCQFDHELPKTLCSFFWQLVSAILIIPFTYPSFIGNFIFYHIIDRKQGRRETAGYIYKPEFSSKLGFALFLFSYLPALFMQPKTSSPIYGLSHAFLWAPFNTICIVAFFIGIFFIIAKISDYRDARPRPLKSCIPKERKPNIYMGIYKSQKAKGLSDN